MLDVLTLQTAFLFFKFIFGCARSSLLHGHFFSCGDWELLFIAVHGLLLMVASLIAEHGLGGARTSVVVAHGPNSCSYRALEHRLNTCSAQGLSCSPAYGIFPDQGLNPGLLRWQADSLPLSHQGSPRLLFFSSIKKFAFVSVTGDGFLHFAD